MENLEGFAYFYGKEGDSYSFYRIPKILFLEDRFKELTCEAKLLYGLMLDRMSLSMKNDWFDAKNRAYIYFSIADAMEMLGCKRSKAIATMQELDSEKGIGLIEKVKQGVGRPDRIYVKNFIKTTDRLNEDITEVRNSYYEDFQGMKNRLSESEKQTCESEIHTSGVCFSDPNNNKYNKIKVINHIESNQNMIGNDDDFELKTYDDLPIVPAIWKKKVISYTKKQFQVVKKLMNDKSVHEIICATDAGREGELIFRLVYEKAGCKKPVKRLWISSMESKVIKQGFENLKDGSYYDDLFQSALCRAQADWIIGINASRLFSVLYNKNLKIGRVQTPTLAMIVDRNQRISSFKKEKFYEVRLLFQDMEAVSEKYTSKDDAQSVAKACQGKMCRILKDEEKTVTVQPPKLYDLTTLQRDANRILGYTAQETLEAAQALYEDELITYPRTDSQYLNDEMEDQLYERAALLRSILNTKSEGNDISYSRVLNSKKVTDHHAIIPTGEVSAKDLKTLDERKRNVLYLIESRFLMALDKPYIYETHQCEVDCNSKRFLMKNKRTKQVGFKKIEREMYLFFGKKLPEEIDEVVKVNMFEEYGPCEAKIQEKWTQPPKQFTEDTLLSAMERAGNEELTEETEKKGLGTPATRAGIIEKLVSSGFVERDHMFCKNDKYEILYQCSYYCN